VIWWLVGGAMVIYLVAQQNQPIAQQTTTIYFPFDDSPDDPTVLPMTPQSVGIDYVSQAIAYAEGYFTPMTIPYRTNNPGDLRVPGWTGPTDSGFPVFASASEGWSRLYHQLDLIRTGASSVYSPDMTLSQVAAHWTANDQGNWVTNVSHYLNNLGFSVDGSSRIGDLLA
jgi:hypothetical protein